MSTDEVVDLEAARSGGGGLDDSAGGDDDQEVTPQGVVEMVDDDDEALGGEGEVDGQETWLSDLDEDTRDALGAKYKTPAEVARALVESQKLIGTQGKDVGDWRAAHAELAAELEALRSDSNGNGAGQEAQIPSWGEVAQWATQVMDTVDSGHEEPGKAMATVLQGFTNVAEAREKALIKELGEEMAQRTAPLENDNRQTQFAREITALKREHGDRVYAQHAEEAAALIEDWGREDPSFRRNPRSIRTAFNQVIASASSAARREAEAGILERSGPGPRGGGEVSAAKAILADMDEITGPRRNGGGGL